MRNRFEADDIEFRVAGNGAADEHVPMDGSVREIDRIVNNMLTLKRSLEYGSQIIYGMETGEPQVIYGNVMNDGLIDNLPQDCCVEVPCLVDKNGVQPVHVGALPCIWPRSCRRISMFSGLPSRRRLPASVSTSIMPPCLILTPQPSSILNRLVVGR